jgi:hypothetical protein
MTREILIASLAATAASFLLIAGVRSGALGPFAASFSYLLREIDFYACLPLALALLAALLRPLQRAGLALAAWCGAHPVQLAAVTLVGLALGARFVYHAHPLSMDEYAPYFQSTVYASGELAGRFPPPLVDWLVPKQFQNMFFRLDRETGAVIGFYWPGMALLLAPFTALGVPWLLNPLIGGATVLVMHRLGRELFASERAAGLVALFTLASPAVTLNAVSFYSMPGHLLCNAIFTLLLLRPTQARAFLAGVAGSVTLVLHNPVPHLLYALPWIIWLAIDRARRRTLAGLLAGYLPLCLLLGLGWISYIRAFGSARNVLEVTAATEPLSLVARLLGNVLRMPSEVLLQARVLGLAKLWIWAAPALLVTAAIGAWRLRDETGPWLVLACAALATYAGFFFVPYDQGHGWGFRYFHSAWLVIPLFAAAALEARGGVAPDEAAHAGGYLAGCALLGLVAMTPYDALQVERFVRRHLEQVPAATSGTPRVVIIDTSHGFYTADLVQNDPFLRNPVLKLASRGKAADEAMMRERFPELSLLSSSERGTVWGVPGR